MALIRYRTGMDRETGQVLVGWPHCRQHMGTILTTLFDERVMLLEYGSDLVRFIGRNTVAPIVAKVYRAAFAGIRTWEPEFRPKQAQLLYLDGIGGLALGMRGTYFPEGRLGNFSIAQAKGAAFAIQASEQIGRSFDLDSLGVAA